MMRRLAAWLFVLATVMLTLAEPEKKRSMKVPVTPAASSLISP